MPQYDFRCEACQLRFSVAYRTVAEYDAASLACPQCQSAGLSRVITDVAVSKAGRDYRKLSSGEMLSVLESGDQRQVKEMFNQVAGGLPAAAEAASDDSDKSRRSPPATDSD